MTDRMKRQGKMESKEDVERLKRVLKTHKDSLTRAKAVEALGALGEPAVEPLLRALHDEHWDVRRRAAWELGNIGDPAVKPLIHALNDERWDVRRKAAWALGNIKAPQAIEPLIHTLEDDRADVREQAAWALGALRDLRAVEPLIQALTDKNSGVRRETARSLAVLTVINEAHVTTKLHEHESALNEQKRAAFQECKELYEQELDKARVKRAA